jgi:hypothetical protein
LLATPQAVITHPSALAVGHYQDLVDKYNTQLAAMFDEHRPLEMIVKTWQKLGTTLEGEFQAILLQRYSQKEALTELHFIDDGHYLLKKDFRLPVGRSGYRPKLQKWRTSNPKDEKTLAYLRQLKKDMESQLEQAMQDPGATLNSMRDLHSKLQNQLYGSIKEAAFDKKNRSDWFQNMLKNTTWAMTTVLSTGGVAYAIERYVKMIWNWITGNSDSDSNSNSNASNGNGNNGNNSNTNHVTNIANSGNSNSNSTNPGTSTNHT